MHNKKIISEWDGDPIWRELTLAERIRERDEKIGDPTIPLNADTDRETTYDDGENDQLLAETL
jgi:hypothetical protein